MKRRVRCIPIFLKQQSRTVSMCSNISTRLVLYAPFHLSLTYLPLLPNALPGIALPTVFKKLLPPPICALCIEVVVLIFSERPKSFPTSGKCYIVAGLYFICLPPGEPGPRKCASLEEYQHPRLQKWTSAPRRFLSGCRCSYYCLTLNSFSRWGICSLENVVQCLRLDSPVPTYVG